MSKEQFYPLWEMHIIEKTHQTYQALKCLRQKWFYAHTNKQLRLINKSYKAKFNMKRGALRIQHFGKVLQNAATFVYSGGRKILSSLKKIKDLLTLPCQ